MIKNILLYNDRITGIDRFFLELILLNRHELSQDFGSYHEGDYWFNSGALQ